MQYRKELLERRANCEQLYNEDNIYEAYIEMARIDYYLANDKWPRRSFNKEKLDQVLQVIRDEEKRL